MSKNIQVFVEGIEHYFAKLTNEPAITQKPVLIDDITQYIYDYTGVIGISGSHQGAIFFSSSKGLLAELLTALEITGINEVKKMDLVGEVSNTISGNARSKLGGKFMVSPPVILKGKSEKMQVPHIEENYVIAIAWKGHKANLIVSLEK